MNDRPPLTKKQLDVAERAKNLATELCRRRIAGVVIFVEGGRIMTADHHSCADLDRRDDQITRAISQRMRAVTAEVLASATGDEPAVLEVELAPPTRRPS